MNTLLRWDPISDTRWNPFKDREELESRLASMLGTRAATGNGGKEALTVAQWSPLVDIIEDEKEYLIKAEPDMKKEDVRLTVENEVLTISGERTFEKEEKGKNIIGSNAPTEASCAASHFRKMRMGAGCLPTSRTGCSKYISRNPRRRSRKPSKSR